jgi:hypothetical protein
MKKIYFLLLLLLPFAELFAQKADTPAPPMPLEVPPYIANPVLPAFNILLPDSITTVSTFDATKGRPTIIIVFMPDCEHCQKFTERMLKGIDSLEEANIYMVTPMGPGLIRQFIERFGISKYKNIVIGRDREYTAMGVFRNQFVPFIVVYDKKRQLVTHFEQTASATDLYKAAFKHIKNPLVKD